MLSEFPAIDLVSTLLLGLTGSLHCAGMCGGLACTYTLPISQNNPQDLWKYHFTYISGRVLIYSWLGAIMGALGMVFTSAMRWPSWVSPTAIGVAGGVMILGGLATVFGQAGPERLNLLFSQGTRQLIHFVFPPTLRFGAWRAFPLGLLSGLLPCGLMWAVELKAFATQSLFWGMIHMTLFCIVTTPGVLLTGIIMSKVTPHFRFRSVQFAGIIVILMGVHLLWRHGMKHF
ncbi:sulfite exporter TauE/SafE family protein [Deltaproteobacteria bacterium TL4]